VRVGGGGVLRVVVGAFGGVGKDFVGFDDFAETVCGGCCGGLVGGVVWMVLFYELKVAGFYFFLGCVVGESEDFVGRGGGGVSWPGNVGTGRGI
jgi:hypothetical protein